jgi:hypothetical protein
MFRGKWPTFNCSGVFLLSKLSWSILFQFRLSDIRSVIFIQLPSEDFCWLLIVLIVSPCSKLLKSTLFPTSSFSRFRLLFSFFPRISADFWSFLIFFLCSKLLWKILLHDLVGDITCAFILSDSEESDWLLMGSDFSFIVNYVVDLSSYLAVLYLPWFLFNCCPKTLVNF